VLRAVHVDDRDGGTEPAGGTRKTQGRYLGVDAFISLDCESNGLHGQIFAAAAVLYINGREAESWGRRCAIDGDVDPWVRDNVLPTLDEPYLSRAVSPAVIAHDWRRFFERHGGRDTPVVTHIPWPVEARFLWSAHQRTPFSGPYPLIDVASMLHGLGLDPTSVDGYLKVARIARPDGSPHHPLYDARAAGLAYLDLR
jgi:hypothetical protein